MVGKLDKHGKRYPSTRMSKKRLAMKARKKKAPTQDVTTAPAAEPDPDSSVASTLVDIADLQLGDSRLDLDSPTVSTSVLYGDEMSDLPLGNSKSELEIPSVQTPVLSGDEMSELPTLICEHIDASPKRDDFEVGVRLVHVSHLYQAILNFSQHSSYCDIHQSSIIGEERKGLRSILKIRCGMCNFVGTVSTHEEAPASKMPINLAMTSGIYSAGIGYNAMAEVAAACDLPFFSFNTFKYYEKTYRERVFDTADKDMEEAAAIEAKLATEAGHIDRDGVPLVTVVIDGSWAKRSYKTKYNSLSGLAVIVGAQTKKVLFMGVKNRYCLLCARTKPGNETPSHLCFKNWDGSASSIESAVVLEGFQRSEELYGIRYNKIIADGDSSVYNALIKNRPYKNTAIEKVECINHLLRNLCRKLRTVAENKVGTTQLRRIVGSKIKALRGAVNAASKHWAAEAGSTDEKTEYPL